MMKETKAIVPHVARAAWLRSQRRRSIGYRSRFASVQVRVTLVASSLGTCHGHLAYRRLGLTFEYKGHKHPGTKENIC